MTDIGITNLLFNQDDLSYNACQKTLRFVKLRGTRVRKDGIQALLKNCVSLEGVRCNIMDVLQALSTFLKVS